MEHMDCAGIADRFFEAIGNDDMTVLEALYADDIRVWHSFDDHTQDKTENIAMLSGLRALGAPEYRIVERMFVGERLVQRHELIIRPWDGGAEHRLHVAFLMTIVDGKITAIDEYLDSAKVAEVQQAIVAAGTGVTS